jgi:hypothetical protein
VAPSSTFPQPGDAPAPLEPVIRIHRLAAAGIAMERRRSAQRG